MAEVIPNSGGVRGASSGPFLLPTAQDQETKTKSPRPRVQDLEPGPRAQDRDPKTETPRPRPKTETQDRDPKTQKRGGSAIPSKAMSEKSHDPNQMTGAAMLVR